MKIIGKTGIKIRMEQVIEHYQFGKIKVSGQTFSSDIVIHADGRVQDNWRRRKGHDLVAEDIKTLLDPPPGRLIIGTGSSGLMRVSESVMEEGEQKGIRIEAFPTPEAVKQFNRAAKTDVPVAACFHLTC